MTERYRMLQARMSPARPRLAGACLVALAVLATPACAATLIPNTDVDDTDENRDVIAVCEQYRHAVERRSVRDLLALASPRYFEDAGTPTGDDDFDLRGLRGALGRWGSTVTAIRYEMRYHRVSYEHRRALVDYTYTASFRVHMPDVLARRDSTETGRVETERWIRRVADNRLELERVSGRWRILSGM